MNKGQKKWLTDKFSQNFIIQHPFYGGLLISLFFIVFAILYKPLGSHAGRFLGYEATMITYALISGTSVLGLINLLKLLPLFSNKKIWTLGKELLAIFLLLLGTGIIIFLAAFILEEKAERWNFPTFFDSMKKAYLIGIIPFLFFTLMNIRFLMSPVNLPHSFPKKEETAGEKPILINSQLKKESLSFYPGQLIYAVSDSNYVNFYLQNGEKIQKKIIRNSISEIEKQLASIPYFFRTHRAFIVNLNKVSSVKGNSLGYRLKLHGTEEKIPVSRSNTHHFIRLCKEYT